MITIYLRRKGFETSLNSRHIKRPPGDKTRYASDNTWITCTITIYLFIIIIITSSSSSSSSSSSLLAGLRQDNRLKQHTLQLMLVITLTSSKCDQQKLRAINHWTNFNFIISQLLHQRCSRPWQQITKSKNKTIKHL